MDDRKPGSKIALEPSAMGATWSLSQSLDGALRRAKPKASLSRHLVGYRAASSDENVADAPTIDAADDPDARAAVARAAQSGEVAWAHERVALIGRALDAEAQRLAADPQKAGKVAEHLAPLIEKAFAGASAEAPGDYARAIVDREREPLETELLAERAVMSVAATRRAEREGRSTAFADELAMLKEQPQRWAAANARQGRAIDDLPLDETRRNALKGAAARAQANAAAEGLLLQDASWLLEDLDDPEFANALGTDDAARWRSAAEEAVARRAERIAAEGAERALLAASDMRAALKRFKDKDDGPLPSRDEIVAALGSEAVADAVLSETLKGRKHRHAESAVALMSAAEEGAWLDAAPDKETRTIRELAAATKRTAVAANPGRWLMQHSATLKELADVAVEDPTQLPQLADHYAALRNQVRGRAAGDVGTGEAPAGAEAPNALALDEDAPLPDDVAADLVEQVLAGETPHARLEALTAILDSAADGGSADADDRARADAIAHQLEALGLPEGTATRWAQFTDPHTRRSARLALLGGFAKQIRNEEAILSGEGEGPEIVGEEGNDTLSWEAITQNLPFPRGAGAATQSVRQQQIRERLNELLRNDIISEEERDRFLADERLASLTDVELPEDVIAALESGDRSGLVEALSVASDYILAGAGKLAELEEEYGQWIRGAIAVGRTVLFGPVSAFLSGLADLGIEEFMKKYGQEAIAYLLEKATDLVQGGLGIENKDRGVAQKIAIAGVIAGSLLLGVGSIAKIIRHTGSLRSNTYLPDQTMSRSATFNVPPPAPAIVRGGAELQDVQSLDDLMRRLSHTKLPSNQSFMEHLFLSRKLLDLTPSDKALSLPYFQRIVLPRAAEIELEGVLAPLVTREGLLLLTQYRFPIGLTGKFSVPDFTITRRHPRSLDPETDFPALMEFIRRDLTAIIDAKTGASDYTSNQRLLKAFVQSISSGADSSKLYMPNGALSEVSLLNTIRETFHRAPTNLPRESVDQIVQVMVKTADPRLPVWVLVVSGMVALGALEREETT